jgi:3-oxoacyl-[acyl-carrier protein] reductase
MRGNALKGKVAIVTGVSRRRGIGFAIAQQLSALGSDLLLNSFASYDAAQPWGADSTGPSSLAEELRRDGVRVEIMTRETLGMNSDERITESDRG